MQYVQGNDTRTMMNSYHIVGSPVLSLAKDPQIKRTRKILLIILGVCFVLSVLGAINGFISTGITDTYWQSERYGQSIRSVISVLYFALGYLVAYRYYSIGLRVFAWVCIIDLIISGIAFGLIIYLAFTYIATQSKAGDEQFEAITGEMKIVILFAIIVIIISFILTMVIIKLAFKLATLIENKKSKRIQQM